MSHAGTRIPYLAGLDGVRGLAVALVLLFHAGHLRGGWLGVDVFFVLSGFLITSLLVAEWQEAGRVSLFAFWGRRARRLLPALFAVLLAVAVYAKTIAPLEELELLRKQALATLLYVANWEAISTASDYWAQFSTPTPLHHAWSLGIEEQFYVVWPLLVVLVLWQWRGRGSAVATTAVVLAAAAVAWTAWLFEPGGGTARVYYGSDTRAPALLIGAALAIWLRERVAAGATPGGVARPRAELAALLGGALAMAALGYGAVVASGREPLLYRGGLAALGVCSAVVIAAVVVAPRGPLARLLAAPPLRSLGLVSYGVYLWHWPIYVVLTPERAGVDGWALTGVRVGLTLVVATVSYLALERPIRRATFGVKLGVPIAVAVAATVALATVESTRQSDGVAAGEVAGEVAAIGPGYHDGRTTTGGDGAAGQEEVDVLFVGDSLIDAMAKELAAEGARRGLRVKVWGAPACGLVPANRSRDQRGEVLELSQCPAVRSGWMQSASLFRPRVQVLLEGWIGIGEREVEGTWTQPCEPLFDRPYEAALRSFVANAPPNMPVWIALAPPASVPDLFAGAMGKFEDAGEAQLLALASGRMKCQNDLRRRVIADTRAEALDLEGVICPDGKCLRDHDGVRLRRDGIHFRGPAAQMIAQWIFDELEARGPLTP